MIQNLLKAALEQALDSHVDDKEPVKKDDPKREDEVVFYAVMTNPDGLRLADSKVTQQQCEIKVKNKGRVRVRKYSKEGLDPTFELTFKTKSNNAGIEGSIEQNNDINQNIFDGFRALCSEEMTKDRFCFPVKSIQITSDKGTEDVDIEGIFYEVDVFFNEDGSYNENIKIDLEVNKLLDYINQKRPDIGDFRLNVKIMDLPFKPHQVIVKDKNTTEEDNQKIQHLYDTIFIKKIERNTAVEGFFDFFKRKKKQKDNKQEDNKEETLKDILESFIKEIEGISESKIKVSFNKINKDFDLTIVLKDMDILERLVEFNYSFVKKAEVWLSRMFDELKKKPIDKDSIIDLYKTINNEANSFILSELKKIGNFNKPFAENKEYVVTDHKTFIIALPKLNIRKYSNTSNASELPEFDSLVYFPFLWSRLNTGSSSVVEKGKPPIKSFMCFFKLLLLSF